MAKPIDTPEPESPTPAQVSRTRLNKQFYRSSQRLDRHAPMTAAGTKIRQRDQLNEWIAYCMVVLIFIMIGNLGERWWDMRQGKSREFPPELQAALDVKASGGRMAVNAVTGVERAPDDPAREQELIAATKADHEDAESLRSLADYYYDTLQVDAAVDAYTHYLEHSPDDVSAMTDLAAMQFMQIEEGVLPKDMDPNKGPVAAVATLNEAVEVDPTFAPAWQMLGWAQSRIGNTQKAIDAYQNAIAHTTDPQTKHGLEQVIAQLGGETQAPVGAPGSTPRMNPLTGQPVPPPDEAKEAAIKAKIEAAPSDPVPHLELGHYYYDIFAPDLAAKEYEAYLALGGDPTAAVRTDYATVLSEIDMPRALTELDKITKDHPEFFAAWVNLATLRVKSGDRDGGIAALKGALGAATEEDRVSIQAQLDALAGN